MLYRKQQHYNTIIYQKKQQSNQLKQNPISNKTKITPITNTQTENPTNQTQNNHQATS